MGKDECPSCGAKLKHVRMADVWDEKGNLTVEISETRIWRTTTTY